MNVAGFTWNDYTDSSLLVVCESQQTLLAFAETRVPEAKLCDGIAANLVVSAGESMERAKCLWASLSGALFLASCATAPSAEIQAKRAEFARTTPICVNGPDCNAKWEAAQLWVVHNSGYKIQTATSVVIETYNPAPHQTSIAVRITKEPIGSGRYKFLISVWCDNVFRCIPNELDASLDFNKSIAAATP